VKISAYITVEPGEKIAARIVEFDKRPALDLGDLTHWMTWEQMAVLHDQVNALMQRRPQAEAAS
jgi:hypothetical protein